MGFISVNDRLPEEKRPLVVVKGKSVCQKTYENGMFYDGTIGVAGYKGVVEPTHWMYLSDLLGEIDGDSDQSMCAV